MASTTAPAVTVPLFHIMFDSWFRFGKGGTPPEEGDVYKRRIDCLNSLARIQGELRRMDKTDLGRIEAAVCEYKSAWDKCEGIIRPK